jgi:hypothetical protein
MPTRTQSPEPLCDIRQPQLDFKMKIATTFSLIVLFASCGQASEQEPSTPKVSATEVKNNGYANSITITDNDYVLHLNGFTDTFETVAQLRNTLEKAVGHVGKDTMYIYMKSTIADRLREVSPMLRSIGINKYQHILTDDYFALPYSKDTQKAEQQ